MNTHDLLARASDAPPPPEWDVPDVLAAGRRRQRRQRFGGAFLAVLAIGAISYAVVEMPSRVSGDAPPVLASCRSASTG